MPRLSTQRYLSIHHELKHLWLTNMSQFAYLSSKDQYNLHGYFQITSDELDDMLLRNRTELTKLCPSLPHQAGKAFKHLRSIPPPQPRPVALVKGQRRYGEKVVSMRSVVRPTPDVQKLARAFVAFMSDDGLNT